MIKSSTRMINHPGPSAKTDDTMTDLEIIDANYCVQNDEPIVEIYGRQRDGKSVTVLCYDFEPYCYFEHNDIITRKILRESDKIIRRHEIVELEHMLEKRKFTKVYTRVPTDVRALRRKYEKETTFMSADIIFPLRFIYDLDLGHYITVEGTEIKSHGYTTDVVIKAETISNCEPFQQSPVIMSFDIETSLKNNNILTICSTVDRGNEDKEEYVLEGDERKILRDWIDLVSLIDPDILTGYNIIFYDLPKIEERAKHHKLKVKICRDGSEMWGKKDSAGRTHYNIRGRVIADAWLHTKLIKKPKRERLNDVAQEYLNEEKMDVNAKAIDQEWADDKDKVIEYCLKDADLALRILKYIKVVDKNIALSTVANLPLSTVFENRTSTLADSLLIRMADRQGVAVPCTNRYETEEKIEGAYVRQPEPGVYKWVLVLDFKSMYPAIIMKNNLCLTTYAPGIGEIETPVGAHFLSKDIREGMVPKVMQKLLDDRVKCKQELKRVKKEKAPKNIIDYWDDLQYSVKVLANSFYGLFTSAFYRFTNRKIGESITAFARKNIKEVIKQLEAEGLDVIYSDTDSVFFLSPKEDLEESIKFGQQISERFSEAEFELEFEKIMSRWFTHGKKKRYFGKVVWPEEDTYIRGYETRRKDSFNALTDTLEKMFDLVMDDKQDEAVQMARQMIIDARTGKVPLDSLVISKSCKPEEYYARPDSLPQVQCSRKLKEMGEIVAPFMSVAWIVTNSRVSPMTVEPFLSKERFVNTPDWDYYAVRLAQALGRITEVFGWDEERLYTGTQQSDLFSFGK